MKKFIPFTTAPGVGAHPLTVEQAATFLAPSDIAAGQLRGHLKTFGPWQIPVSYKALAVSRSFKAPPPQRDQYTVHGYLTLTQVHQSGQQLEGRVSIGGKSYRGFTSSVLFELPEGKLVDVATIHICK